MGMPCLQVRMWSPHPYAAGYKNDVVAASLCGGGTAS